MSAVVEAVTGAVSGVVEAVGDVVESVGDALSDVGQAVDKYVIQPILDDPLTAIASVAAAVYLGPVAASYFGTSAAVGTGLAVAGANTAAGLVQGESFDEAIKGGAIAGLTAGATQAAFGPSAAGEGPMGPPAPAGLGENFVGPPMESGSYFTEPLASSTPVDLTSPPTGTDLPPLEASAPAPAPELTPEVPVQDSPLRGVTPKKITLPGESISTTPSSPLSMDYSVPKIDLTTGLPQGPGLQANPFTPANSFDIYGEPNFSMSGSPNVTSGPGMQLTDSPYLSRMGGAQGVTVPVQGMDQFTYGPGAGSEMTGVNETWQRFNDPLYGKPSPSGTLSASGVTPTQPNISYGSENIGEMGTWDKFTSGDLMGTAKDLGTSAWDYAKEHPWYTAAGVVAADQLLNPRDKPEPPKPTSGKTRDARFDKGLDLYSYLRDRRDYQGDLTKYGQAGQGGEQNFFANERFVPIPIAAKMGGLIQMKHFAQGGQMQDPRRAQMMAAMAQQRPAGMGGPQTGRPMPPQGGRPPMMPPQGGPQGGLQQGMPPQQSQRPQMPQRPRDPKMAYYQYGNPPQAKAMGGLSQVHSMKIGGGADGRSDDVNAVLSDGEYVMDAETVAMLGNGSSKAGAAQLDQMRANLRKQKGQALSRGQISPDAKSPLSYLKGA